MRLLPALLLAIAAAISPACGPGDPESLYVDLGCPRCHGFHLEGNRYGPALDRLGENWDSAQTIGAYLRDPQALVAKDPRLSGQDSRYELKMQRVTAASDEELIILSTWLLRPPSGEAP